MSLYVSLCLVMGATEETAGATVKSLPEQNDICHSSPSRAKAEKERPLPGGLATALKVLS